MPPTVTAAKLLRRVVVAVLGVRRSRRREQQPARYRERKDLPHPSPSVAPEGFPEQATVPERIRCVAQSSHPVDQAVSKGSKTDQPVR
jgi:hypothetical protein